MPKSKSYQPKLLEALRDPEEAVEYLNAALEEGDRELFLLALRNVADARGGLSKLAEATDLNRENLYRMLSEKGNPEFYSLNALLDALGFRIAVGLKRNDPNPKSKEGEIGEIFVLYPRKVSETQSENKFSLAADTSILEKEITVLINSEGKVVGNLNYDFQRGELFLDNILNQRLPNWLTIAVAISTKDGKHFQGTCRSENSSRLVLLQEVFIKIDDVEQITLMPQHSKKVF